MTVAIYAFYRRSGQLHAVEIAPGLLQTLPHLRHGFLRRRAAIRIGTSSSGRQFDLCSHRFVEPVVLNFESGVPEDALHHIVLGQN
jgi:hypothetical protein